MEPQKRSIFLLPMSLLHAVNVTNSSESIADEEAPWKSRMREIQGALIVAACFEMLIGLTGLTGFLMRFTGPLTVAPVITLLGILLYPVAAHYCSKNWWMAFAYVFIHYSSDLRSSVLLLSQLIYLQNFDSLLVTSENSE
jgi:xanthine/uracil permease